MSTEVTTTPSDSAASAARHTMLLSFATFVIVWVSLIAGALLRSWTLTEVRDLIILLVGLQAGSLASSPIAALTRVVTTSRPPVKPTE